MLFNLYNSLKDFSYFYLGINCELYFKIINMKVSLVAILLFLSTFFVKNLNAQSAIKYDGKVLVSKIYETLAKLKNIRYYQKRVVDFKSESVYSDAAKGKMNMVFDDSSKIGIKYFFEFDKSYSIYNGKDYYSFSKDGKEKELKENISIDDLNAQSCLNPSINTIKTNFAWLKDNWEHNFTTTDTVVGKNKYSNIYFQFKGKALGTNGGVLENKTEGIIFYYTILIDPNTFLPYKFIGKTSLSNIDAITTTFSNIEINSKNFDTSKFIIPKVKIIKKVPVVKPLSTLNKNWTLPVLNKKKPISKNELKGKVVMLEFFSIACSPCREEIPWLVDYTNKMKDKPFKLLSVDGADNEEQLKNYKKYYQNINYDILYNAKTLEKYYNINGYPEVVLINKKGEVIYKGDLDKEKIEKLVEENL